jgi:ribonuclease P protein component
MLPKSRRLRLTRDFERVFAIRGSAHGSLFKAKIGKNNLKYTRFAVVVSSKVSKRAVVRNRIRRRAWSVISELEGQLPVGFDLIIMANPEAARAEFPAIQRELHYLLSKRVFR